MSDTKLQLCQFSARMGWRELQNPDHSPTIEAMGFKKEAAFYENKARDSHIPCIELHHNGVMFCAVVKISTRENYVMIPDFGSVLVFIERYLPIVGKAE